MFQFLKELDVSKNIYLRDHVKSVPNMSADGTQAQDLV